MVGVGNLLLAPPSLFNNYARIFSLPVIIPPDVFRTSKNNGYLNYQYSFKSIYFSLNFDIIFEFPKNKYLLIRSNQHFFEEPGFGRNLPG